MFSTRLDWNLPPNRLSVLLEEKRRQGAAVLDLTESNPTHVELDYPEQAILRALAQPASLRYEPAPRGNMEARRAVAEYYRQRGEGVEPEQIHLTASTSEAYASLFKLLCDPGDRVLVPQPSYPLFDYLAALEGVRPVAYPLVYEERQGWRIDFEGLARAATGSPRAIVLVNPNNPTGSFVKREELPPLIRLCREHSLALIVDEVFSDYAFGADARRVETLVSVSETLTFVLSGLSKVVGLPQMKLAWIVVNGPEELRRQAQEHLDFILDTYLTVSTPIQQATPRWLALRTHLQGQIARRVTGNYGYLSEQMRNARGCRLLHAEGGWYAVLEVPRHAPEEQWVLTLLDQEDVLVHPGYFFDFPREAFVVLSLLATPKVFREGVGRLLARAEHRGDAGVAPFDR